MQLPHAKALQLVFLRIWTCNTFLLPIFLHVTTPYKRNNEMMIISADFVASRRIEGRSKDLRDADGKINRDPISVSL